MSDNKIKLQVMDAICAANGPSSKKAIREATGLAWNTVGRIVDRLVDNRILLEERDAPSQPGRPITNLELNPDNQLLVGIALGGKWWRIVLCSYCFDTVFERKIATPQWGGPLPFLHGIRDFILSSLLQAGYSLDRVFCIGIASSGTIDPENGVLVSALNMGMEAGVHLPLRQDLEALLHKPVLVSSSTVATAWAEYKFGSCAGIRNLLTVGISIGIGAGVIIDGKALVGSPDRPVGTLGHLYIPGNSRLCVCGRKGCLEAFAGGRSLVDVAQERYPDAGWKSAEEIDRAAATGDARAKNILGRAARLDAACIAFLVQIYRPEAIIFTGGQCVVRAFFYTTLCEKLRKGLPGDIAEHLKVSISAIKEYGNAIGAARLAFEQFF